MIDRPSCGSGLGLRLQIRLRFGLRSGLGLVLALESFHLTMMKLLSRQVRGEKHQESERSQASEEGGGRVMVRVWYFVVTRGLICSAFEAGLDEGCALPEGARIL